MREIKFRGKRIDNGELIEGLLLTNKLGTYIITEQNPHECTQYGYLEINQYGKVDPETVGEYAGLKDKHGKKIYEGDNLLISITNYSTGKVAVQKTVPVEFKHCKFGVQWGPSDFTGLDGFSNTTFEIVGHIYEGGQA